MDAGVPDRVAHAAPAARAVLAGRVHVERVAAHAETGELGVDARATRLGALVFLDHQDSGAVAHDEAVAALVPRPRCLLRLVVAGRQRSEEHTSELQSLMRISYAVFCLKKKRTHDSKQYNTKTQ